LRIADPTADGLPFGRGLRCGRAGLSILFEKERKVMSVQHTGSQPMRGRDYRAELARHFLNLYEVAAEVKVHPVRLSRMLREQEAISGPARERLNAFLARLLEQDAAS
jgi:hypothetical protein